MPNVKQDRSAGLNATLTASVSSAVELFAQFLAAGLCCNVGCSCFADRLLQSVPVCCTAVLLRGLRL